ncbi:FHA domain-containing protein [Nostoc sp. NIES-3756]|uniref:FHA domain-containing protein n=1 Tax=Nostoc sp. NIES-3756 TaxID=1751286 RepID=UPI00071F1BCC|nr:FHA domain-containing protein [Nostoc sp. NIES-3756]BAT56505.1 FHA domain-containing protein [Nostoc sp. NIES-3756]BAY35740.1 FHA domain-containing protein [Nostoc sp. NIES-2111]
MPANRCPNPSCEYFNRALPNSAKVCPWCSTPLGNVVAPTPTPSRPNSPQPIPQQVTPQQPVHPSPPVTPQPTYQPPVEDRTNYQQRPPVQPIQPTYNPQPPRLPLLKFIHSSGREFQWSGEAGFIGRRSKTVNIPPEIDLTGIPNEGIVSRRHARVSWDWSQSSYMIVDMSTNGIYLNGTALSPGVQYRLMNGDLLQFGQENLVRFSVYVM